MSVNASAEEWAAKGETGVAGDLAGRNQDLPPASLFDCFRRTYEAK